MSARDVITQALDDVEAFDAALARQREPLLPILLAIAAPDALAAARARLPRPPPGVLARFEVAELVTHGRVGFWAATEWALEVIPGRERSAPVPSFERWDTLVEMHRERPEAPWLVLALFARLARDQRALARRALTGYRRRFGDRGARLARAHEAASSPHGDVLRAAITADR